MVSETDLARFAEDGFPPILFETRDINNAFLDIVEGWGVREYGLAFYHAPDIGQWVVTHLDSGGKVIGFPKYYEAEKAMLRLLALNVNWNLPVRILQGETSQYGVFEDLAPSVEILRSIKDLLAIFDHEITMRKP